MNKLGLGLLSILFCSVASFCQEATEFDTDGMNHQSTKPVHESDIMYKKTILRALDLREKQNLPLFSRDREITKTLFRAAKEGALTIYASDSLDLGSKLTISEFLKRLELPGTGCEEVIEEEPMEEEFEDFGDEFADEEDEYAEEPCVAEYFFPQDIYQMQIKEDYIFDKQRSVMYYDIIAFNFMMPADHPDNLKGIETLIASFSYKECVEKLFTTHPDAIWFNPYNDREHKNLHDAFELRLFSSYIIKVSNPTDEYIVDIYGGDPRTGIMASQWKAFELMEYEHNLWEF